MDLRGFWLGILIGMSDYAKADNIQTAWGLNVDAGMIYRQDKMTWRIGNAPTTVLSELEYKTNAVQPKLAMSVTSPYHFALQIYYADGDIKTGEAYDADYDEPLASLYLLSKSNVIGSMSDWGLMFSKGYSLKNVSATIDIGWSRHKQNLNMINGFQLVPDEEPYYGPISGLNNSYVTQWQGFFWGAGLSIASDVHWQFEANIKQRFFNYNAKANWNLRKEFSHPLSFEHQINANAYEGSLTAIYHINNKCSLKSFITVLAAKGKNGIDTTYFDNGNAQVYFLNHMSWHSRQYGIVFDYKY